MSRATRRSSRMPTSNTSREDAIHCVTARCLSHGGLVKLIIAIAAMFLALPTTARCQDDLLGNYSGYYRKPGRLEDRNLGFTLAITSADHGAVKAHAYRMTKIHICGGMYPLEGTYQDGHLNLASVSGPGGPVGCRMRLGLFVE